MGRGVKRVVEAEKGREREKSREVEASHGHMEREKGMGREGEQEGTRECGTRERRGQAAPFIVGQAYLAVAR